MAAPGGPQTSGADRTATNTAASQAVPAPSASGGDQKAGQPTSPTASSLIAPGSVPQAPQQPAEATPSASAARAMASDIHTLTAAGTTGQNPATQAAGALIGVEPRQNGATRLTISMAPPAIGSVTVHIDQSAGGNAAITVTATHPTTLAALQNDHAALTQALTAAGIAPQHQTVSFHLDAPPTTQTNAAMNAGQGGAPQGGNSHAGLANNQNGGHQGGRPGGEGNGAASSAESAFAQGASRRGMGVVASRVTGHPALHRFGLDVTA